jgi:hypothetical protein
MVRLVEFHKQAKLDFDLVDDIHYYVMNDDTFYRKHYYPLMNKCKQTGNNELLKPIIDLAIKEYSTKYNIPYQFINQLTAEDKNILMQRLIDSEKSDEA